MIELLQSPDWPVAVPSFLICQDTEEDKLDRGAAIISYLGEDLTNKKFLDFGCGEGHAVTQSKALKAIGYDIVPHSGVLTSFDEVKTHGPFDVILLYDVLDHCSSPTQALAQVKEVCHSNTKIIIRCHSWMSRHGAHLHKQLNKAWIHLILNDEEMTSLGLKPENTQKYFYPVNTQKKWFTGFKVEREDIVSSPVSEFFKQFKKRLNIKGKFPEWQMSQDFNDYTLKIK